MFTLTVPEAIGQQGAAWLRTNIGNASIRRREIINTLEHEIPRQYKDWQDWPMERTGRLSFRLSLPLLEVGYFEAKAFFVPENDYEPIWPTGSNVELKVEPADYTGANIIYNAFVRQFGPTKDGRFRLDSYGPECLANLDRDGFAVIPPSGTFRDLIGELDHIMEKLGCRIIQLLPIHPTPTVYGRMGRFGSPFAALDFLDVDPALAEFDRKTTPLQQFEELVDAIHRRHGKIFLDIAINHTGWASKLQVEHPEWFVREKDDSFYSPRAWGVIWEDLSKLDYENQGLCAYIADVFLTWCCRGVDGFRCDAGYKIAWPVWEYIVAKVREEFPDTIFLLEGLGGKVSTTVDLLTKANLNWAYSELFQNYDRSQIEDYLPAALRISEDDGLLIHFAETHDNNRLAATSLQYARLRTALAALLSTNGGYGFANGVEWYAQEKIVVHEAKSLNWNNSANQIEFIAKLSHIVSTHPGFQRGAVIRMIQQGEGNSLACLRYVPNTDIRILILVNLDHENHNLVAWPSHEVNTVCLEMYDLLSDGTVTLTDDGDLHRIQLSPGQVFCLTPPGSPQYSKLPVVLTDPQKHRRNIVQNLQAVALETYYACHPVGKGPEIDVLGLAKDLYRNPWEFCQRMNPRAGEDRVITWSWPWDSRREVMVPPKFFLHFTADHPFHVEIKHENTIVNHRQSLPQQDGAHFVLIPPQPAPSNHTSYACCLEVYMDHQCVHTEGRILYLSEFGNARVCKVISRSDILATPMSILCTNGRGGMAIANAAWGKLTSRYDALLAANLNPEYPEDRWIMLNRCRIWMIYESFSREINLDFLNRLIQVDNSQIIWRFVVPFCNGKSVQLDICLEMLHQENTVRLSFFRRSTAGSGRRRKREQPATLIIKPDIDDRNFHEDTKAFTGPEEIWPTLITTENSGFTFAPDRQRFLRMDASKGQFFTEHEWEYMVHHTIEEERGLHAYSDLYSPGYFKIPINPGESVILSATVTSSLHPNVKRTKTYPIKWNWGDIPDKVAAESLGAALLKTMRHFIVKRQKQKTVIAGYPWFLDWGRDTLICTRGMIAAKMLDDVKAILKQFAQFEQQGTLPNMIRGDDVGNRETSDAPLWFFTACADLVSAERHHGFLKSDCGGRSILEVLKSIVDHYISGTPNGIRMDPKSGLIYSPSHFTWMDTNFPAGTPRQGYPIEIQALWYAAITFMAKVDRSSKWNELAERVRTSIIRYFYRDFGYLSDCLHAHDHQSAEHATPDDHLRPNQLLAITLGAVQDDNISRQVLNACKRLLIPSSIRSLDNRGVHYALPIYHEQQALNDPHKPYWGNYQGDEDRRRKPAYHNGTAWTWIFPSFSEAWYYVYREHGKQSALAILGSAIQTINSGCLGQVPEILDGDFPHHPRGCIAQAWGVTELYRVITLLDN